MKNDRRLWLKGLAALPLAAASVDLACSAFGAWIMTTTSTPLPAAACITACDTERRLPMP